MRYVRPGARVILRRDRDELDDDDDATTNGLLITVGDDFSQTELSSTYLSMLRNVEPV